MDADRIIKDMTMQEILAVFPRAQRALFSRYHVGGCSTCGFQPTETLEQVGTSQPLGALRRGHAGRAHNRPHQASDPPRRAPCDRRLESRTAHYDGAIRPARGPGGSRRARLDPHHQSAPRQVWHDVIGEPTLADAICDRLIHTAHVIELHGPSLGGGPSQRAAQKLRREPRGVADVSRRHAGRTEPMPAARRRR